MARSNRGGSEQLNHLENEVSEVTSLLRNNVEKVVERGERIDNLQSRSEDLECSSSHFKNSAVKLRKKMWWKNCKMMCILGSVIFIIIAVVIVIILMETKPWEHSGNGTPVAPTTVAPTKVGPTTLAPTTLTPTTVASTTVASTTAASNLMINIS